MKRISTFCHTHWDYEWYFSENESVVQLMYHMDDVIHFLKSNPHYVYMLDGQMAIIEDYFTYVPEKKPEVMALVQSGQLLIGPWYSQTDSLIISGESIVRNLWYGMQSAQALGPYLKIGYLPDSFGQSQNLPKIYEGFQLKYSIFWRGVDKHKIQQREFIWKSDTSQVLCYNIKNGYFYGGEAWMENDCTQAMEDMFLDQCARDDVLLPIGSDQRKVDFRYEEMLNLHNQNTQRCTYIQESPFRFMERLEKVSAELPVVEGEFISSQDSKIHHSIYSTRYDHKYLHDKVERRMIYQLEPLAAILNYEGLPIKHHFIQECWKILMRSQAHDSACGCNSDKTNKVIATRLEKANQLSYSFVDYLLRKYAESLSEIKPLSLLYINTLAFKRQRKVETLVNTRCENFILEDCGQSLPFHVLSQEKVYGGVFGNDPQQYDQKLYYYRTVIVFDLDMDAYEKKVIDVKEGQGVLAWSKPQTLSSIENKYYQVYYEKGKIQLFVKDQNIVIDEWMTICDEADDGDSYDFSPDLSVAPQMYQFQYANVDCYPDVKKMIISGTWMFAENQGKRRQDCYQSETPYQLVLELKGKSINCYLEVTNKAHSHRLRVYVKNTFSSQKSFADTAFGLVERDYQPIEMKNWRENGYKEEPSPIYPMLNICGMKNATQTMAIFTQGIKEYEMVAPNIMALTLYRSVGILGKADLVRRPGSPSGNQFQKTWTPDAQMEGNMAFMFSIHMDRNMTTHDIMVACQDYITDILYYQKQEMNRFTTPLQYFGMHPLENIGLQKFQLDIQQKDILCTALIPIDEKSFGIRLMNTSSRHIEATVKLPHNVKGCQETYMNFVEKKHIALYGSVMSLEFENGEIKTLLCYYE